MSSEDFAEKEVPEQQDWAQDKDYLQDQQDTLRDKAYLQDKKIGQTDFYADQPDNPDILPRLTNESKFEDLPRLENDDDKPPLPRLDDGDI